MTIGLGLQFKSFSLEPILDKLGPFKPPFGPKVNKKLKQDFKTRN